MFFASRLPNPVPFETGLQPWPGAEAEGFVPQLSASQWVDIVSLTCSEYSRQPSAARC